MKTKVLWSLCLLVLAGSVHAQQKYELTVQEAVDLAFKNVIELKNAQLDYRIQEAKNKEIVGQALPQISGNLQGNHYVKLPTILFPQSEQGIYDVLKREGLVPAGTTVPDPTLIAFSFQQPWNFAAGATVTQLLFQPDVFVGLQARKASLEYNQSLIEEAKARIKDSAYKRYYAILVAQKQLFFLNESVKRLEKLASDINEIYKNGFAERLDVDKVQVQLNNLRTTRSLVDNAVTLSYAAMKFALGISQKDTVVLKDELTIEGLKEGILDQSFAYEDRAEIRTLNTLQSLQKLDIKRYKLGFLPTVALSGNYSVNGMGQKFFTDESTFWYRSAFIGLNVNLPIFTGFQRKYKVEQSKLTLEKLNNTVENVKQAIDFEQVVTRESLANALLNLDAQEENLELAEKVFNATRIKYENGVGSSQEVLQADTDYQNAQGNYFNALYNATVARISYLHSLGKLQ
jgi:outer membrane protein TolC